MKLIATLLISLPLTSLCAFDAKEKIYIDSKEMDMSQDRFKIHVGHNEWIETTSLTRDEMGLYTLEANIIRPANATSGEYVRQWKCPYCFNWWPMGRSCKNPNCPSKFPEALKVKNL